MTVSPEFGEQNNNEFETVQFEEDLGGGGTGGGGGGVVGDRYPAPLSLLPTTTTNPARPRTVAAGYSKERRVLTVIFRDGTLYNYYGVPDSVWRGFKMAYSKGWFLHASGLDDWPDKGPADISVFNEQEQMIIRTLHESARTEQRRSGGLYHAGQAAARRGSTQISQAYSERLKRQDVRIKQRGVRDPFSGKVANPYTGKVKRAPFPTRYTPRSS